MKNKTPLILGGVFIVLVVIFLATSINPPEKSEGAQPLFEGERPDIDKLEMSSKNHGTIVVEEQNGVWNITSPVPATTVSRATRSFERLDSPAWSARPSASTRRWIESSTRMLLSSSMPKQIVSPLIVMKLTEMPKK